jgi:regulatory protein
MNIKSLIQLVLGYLAIRARSKKELLQYISNKSSDEEQIAEVVDYLEAHRLIDDEEFALHWTESRLRHNKGDLYIQQELRIKGINDSIIKQVLLQIDTEKWNEAIKNTLEKYQNKLLGLEGFKRKSKMYAILGMRGFGSSRIDAFLRSKVE